MASYFIAANAPTLLPHFAIGQYIYGFAFLSTRGSKIALGIDHNVNPRADLATYGEKLVSEGKISRRTLDKVYRREAAHQNTMSSLPLFWFSALMAQYAGLPNAFINKSCLAYTITRVLYGYAYIQITDPKKSYLRSLLWWISNFISFYTVYKAGQKLNAGL